MNNTPSDEQLAAAYIASNDQSAFDELFRRYAKPLFYYILKHSWFKDEDHIDRIVQLGRGQARIRERPITGLF